MVDEEIGKKSIYFDNVPPNSSCIAGQDATEAFYGLHRQEVLAKPQYTRLQIGVVEGEAPEISMAVPGSISKVPYGEPNWLVNGYHSVYYKDVSTILFITCVFFDLGVSCFACSIVSPKVPSCDAQILRRACLC